ncbi:hypothetical protein Hjap01_03842 [Haloarcula japonica]
MRNGSGIDCLSALTNSLPLFTSLLVKVASHGYPSGLSAMSSHFEPFDGSSNVP